MAQVCYSSWNDPGSLNLHGHHQIPKSALKTLTKYKGTKGMAQEHLEDVAALATLHCITHEDVMIKLLVLSLEGKALHWYNTLLKHKSIYSWDDLAGALINTFDSSQDPFQLLMHLSTITRAPLESITDFNVRFCRSWKRIPGGIQPTTAQACLFYVRAFHPDISLLLLQAGEQRFPQIFKEVVQAEQLLLLSGKWQWWVKKDPAGKTLRQPNH